MKGTYGDYRSRREDRDWAGAWVAANLLKREDEKEAALRDWWLTADLEVLGEEVVWRGTSSSDEHPALWWLDEGGWRLRFKKREGPDLTSYRDLDLQPLQREWARGLALQALDLWERWLSSSSWTDLDLKGAMRRGLQLHLDGSDQAEAERLVDMMMNLITRLYEDAFLRAHHFELSMSRLVPNPSDGSLRLEGGPLRRTPEAEKAIAEMDAVLGALHAARAIVAVVSAPPLVSPMFPDKCAARAAAEGLAAARACLEPPDAEMMGRTLDRLLQEYNLQWTIVVLRALRARHLHHHSPIESRT